MPVSTLFICDNNNAAELAQPRQGTLPKRSASGDRLRLIQTAATGKITTFRETSPALNLNGAPMLLVHVLALSGTASQRLVRVERGRYRSVHCKVPAYTRPTRRCVKIDRLY